MDTPGAGVQPTITASDRRTLMRLFWLAVALSVVGPRIPYDRYLLYPFALLGTWAHEMGHGLLGLITGGGFERLEVYSNLGGVAFTSGNGGRLAAVLVSAGGLLGPAIAGGIVIVRGARVGGARWLLVGLGVAVLGSVALVVRNGFGMATLTAIGVALIVAGAYGPALLRAGLTQLLGVQFCATSWSSIDYLFTKNFARDGQIIDSDTQNIADALWLPYWFWGGVIVAISVAIIGWAFVRAWVRPPGGQGGTAPTVGLDLGGT